MNINKDDDRRKWTCMDKRKKYEKRIEDGGIIVDMKRNGRCVTR